MQEMGPWPLGFAEDIWRSLWKSNFSPTVRSEPQGKQNRNVIITTASVLVIMTEIAYVIITMIAAHGSNIDVVLLHTVNHKQVTGQIH